MASEFIFLENDTLLFLSNLSDKDGNPVIDADVEVTIFNAGGGSAIGGASFPLTLPYVAASNQYELVLDKAVSIVENRDYSIKFTVVSGNSDGVFWKDVTAKRRVV